jgi:hypothetical protein
MSYRCLRCVQQGVIVSLFRTDLLGCVVVHNNQSSKQQDKEVLLSHILSVDTDSTCECID